MAKSILIECAYRKFARTESSSPEHPAVAITRSMITKPDLIKLANDRLKDSEVLFDKKRYFASVYISGFAIELALKYKICELYRFGNGFPETGNELLAYAMHVNEETRILYPALRQLHSHHLPTLLMFSGKEMNVKQNLFREWATVFNWDPKMRYKNTSIKKAQAELNLNAVKKILDEFK